MSVYIYPIKQASIYFLIVCSIVMIPAIIFQYRKYGSVSTRKSIIVYGFLFYMIAAYCLVILPLPPRDSVTTTYKDMMQIIPFHFISDFFKETTLRFNDTSTYLPALIQSVVIQPIFNIFLMIPFGMFLRYYFKKSMKTTILYSFLLSLFFELSQLTGLFWIYPGPYRLFDVDDLMLNTLGGLLGYTLSPLLNIFFPPKEELDRISYEKGMHVTYIRRYIAYLADIVVIFIVSNVIQFLGTRFFMILDNPLIYPIVFILYFAVIPSVFHTSTLGQKLVRISVVSEESKLFKGLMIRSILVLLSFNYSWKILNGLWMIVDSSTGNVYAVGVFIVLGMQLLWLMFLCIHIFYTSRHSHKMFYETISKTKTISVVLEK